MLKNKRAVYILIPLNILIWGFFVYRFYTSYSGQEFVVPSDRSSGFKPEELKDTAVYKLQLNYKDPFLKESPKSLTGQSYPSGRGNETKTLKTQPPAKQFEIRYFGLIKNSSTGLTTGLISVDGTSRLVKHNDKIGTFIIKSFNRDSLVLKSGRERRVIRK